ncbi:hypothetical protein THAOC_21590 [Thalassiosira oceanica]|uniref:Uncharacterized protein n=1 Tax=Thalassiosira oceanica TaxID=159749 RepID=K0SBK9_THAOC|nr:hypothetical protein THAOC_21590 [Thalassiosira oceanica]|eukprot:EJK58301.1 hypothetical protein THAOC_21590 [Thalassiosira oceanica]
MKIEVARSAWKVALSRALGPGITDGVSEGPGKARKARIRRKFDIGLRQKAPFVGKTRRAAGLDRALRPELGRAGSSEWDENYETNGAPAGGGREEKTLGALRRRPWCAAVAGAIHFAHCGGVPKTDAARAGGTRVKKKTPGSGAAAAGARG